MKKVGAIKKLLYCCTFVLGAIFLFNFSHCRAENAAARADHLLINEIFTGTDVLNYSDQFIELYNPTADPISLKGYFISRKTGNTIDLSLFDEIGSEQYFILYRSTDTEMAPNNVLTFRINYASEDILTLIFGADTPVDSVTLNLDNYRGKSISRLPNGVDTDSASDLLISIPTPGETNIKYEVPSIIDEDTGGQEIISIASAEGKENGEEVLVQGIVTAIPGQLSSNYFYIQDETGGIQIYNYDKDFPTLTEGDLISVMGEISSISGERRIKIVDPLDITMINHKEIDPPMERIISDITNDQVGEYIQTTGVVVSTSGDTFSIADSKGKEIKVIIKEGTNIEKPAMKKGDTFQIAGVLSTYNGILRILPFKQEDVKIVSVAKVTLPKTGVPPFIYPIFGLMLTFLWNISLILKKKL
jgi:DNA/RNA endonuclease YhcR with UshA esterase domain